MCSKNKILILTNVFPTPERPNTGFYVFEQVKRLKNFFDLKVIVATPVNIFDSWGKLPLSPTTENSFPTQAVFPLNCAEDGTAVASAESLRKSTQRRRDDDRREEFSCNRHLKKDQTNFQGIDIYQPNYWTFPKMGVLASGFCYEKAVENLVDEIYGAFVFDLIIAYWTYPEGYAAAQIGKKYHVPVLIRPRGSDINVFIENNVLRPLIKKTLQQAQRIIPVTEALKNRIKHLGIAEEKLSFIHNGIDTLEFFPMERGECRKALNIGQQKMILFVGNLVSIKGVEYLLEAIEILDQKGKEYSFYFLGQGQFQEKIGLTSFRLKKVKVSLIGDVPHDKLRWWLNAADVLCLPSLNEGCPNVVMEALACGLPVVASSVGGVPELINDSRLGILVPAKDPEKLATAIIEALGRHWDKEILMDRVKNETWDVVAEKLKEECERLIVKT